MTPQPSPDEIAARHIFDPTPGTVHILDLVAMAKDGIYAKDRVSDHVIGMFLLAKSAGVIKTWEGQLMQLAFVKGMKLRAGYEHIGHAFLDPNQDVIVFEGRQLCGSTQNATLSALTIDELKDDENCADWVDAMLFAGNTKADTTYVRAYPNLNSIAKCDNHVNGKAYVPGPQSTAPPASNATTPTSRKRNRASTAANSRSRGSAASGKLKLNVKKPAKSAEYVPGSDGDDDGGNNEEVSSAFAGEDHDAGYSTHYDAGYSTHHDADADADADELPEPEDAADDDDFDPTPTKKRSKGKGKGKAAPKRTTRKAEKTGTPKKNSKTAAAARKPAARRRRATGVKSLPESTTVVADDAEDDGNGEGSGEGGAGEGGSGDMGGGAADAAVGDSTS